MTVKTILFRKDRVASRSEQSAALEVAIATLAEHRIGALVVLGADRRVIGILSERDIVRTFAEFGSDAPTKRLAQIMTREVATRGEADTAVSIMERMTANRVRHIPVVDRDRRGRHRVDRRHRQTPPVGNGPGVRGNARVYPERLACSARRNLVCASDRYSFQFPRSRARCSDW